MLALLPQEERARSSGWTSVQRLEMMVRLHLLQISLNYSDLQMEVYLTSNVAARLFCRVPSGRTTVSDTSLLRFRGVSGLLCLGRLFQGQPNEAALSFL